MALIQKAFSDIITFSRSSNATRIGPNGLVQYAPHNLLVRSQEFDNAAWVKSSTTVTANAAAAPDGTVTADLVTWSGSSEISQIIAATNGTLSFWAKGVAGQTLFVGISGTSASTMITLSDSWQRYSLSFTGTSTYIYLGKYSGATVTSAYLWGAQLSVGPLALDYTPTTTAAVYGPRFDYDGSGVTSVDPIARNLLTYSEQFDNGAWFKGLATITSNALSAPDGTVTADLATAGAGTGVSEISGQISSGTFANNSVVTFSVYFKAGTKDSVTLSYNVASGNYAVAVFDLSGVSVSQTAQLGTFVLNGSSITSVGSGWFRCSISFTSSNFSATTNVPFVGIAPAKTGNTFNSNGRISATYAGTETVYLWGAQLEIGSTATGYMVSGATNGFRAVPVVTGNATARGLLIEEQRTNSCTYSEQFDNAAWNKTRASVTANAIAAPDGTVTGDKLVEDTSVNLSHVTNQDVTVSASTTYTGSVYFKAAERIWAYINVLHVGISSYRSWFNLSSGTVGSSDTGNTATITSVGNGWYRATVSRSTAVGQTSIRFEFGLATADGNISYTGDGTSGIYVWGAQLEVGSFATSYIPTVASTVTRSADNASVNTLSPFFNATEGTFFTDVDSSNVSSGNSTVFYVYADSSNYILQKVHTDQNLRVGVAGVTVANLACGSPVDNTPVKFAVAYKANDFAGSMNGGTVATDTSGALPTGLTTFDLGKTSVYLNGHIRRLAYYPRRLTNAELQALSA